MIAFIRRYIVAKEREAAAAERVAEAQSGYYAAVAKRDDRKQAEEERITRLVEDRLDALTTQIRRMRESMLTIMVERSDRTLDTSSNVREGQEK